METDVSFVQREIAKLNSAIVAEPEGFRREQFYAAQQALAWALEPTGFRSPFNMIMGIQEAPECCLDEPRPTLSSDIRGPEQSSQ
jgi:hypothetical protein